MTACAQHVGNCQSHDHESPCPECGARLTQPCTTRTSRYAAWCCPGCWHDQNTTTEGAPE